MGWMDAKAKLVPHRIIMKLVHRPLMGGLLLRCIWYSEEGTGRARILPRPLLAVPNVTAQCPPINDQCTNHRMVRFPAVLSCSLKG